MTIERQVHGYTRGEWLTMLGIATADDPKLSALAGLSWGGNGLKALTVNGTENGWEFTGVVALSGAQTVAGAKTFSDTLTTGGGIGTVAQNILGRFRHNCTSDAGLNVGVVLTPAATSMVDSADSTSLGNAGVHYQRAYLGFNTVPRLAIGYSRSSTKGAHTSVLTNNGLGTIDFLGSNGTDFGLAASIGVIAADSPVGNFIPGTVRITVIDSGGTSRVRFQISPTAVSLFSAEGTERLTVTSTGANVAGAYSVSGSEVITSARHHQLRSYTVATLPSAATAGQMIYVSNESGGAVPAFSDGTNWRRVTDRAVVS